MAELKLKIENQEQDSNEKNSKLKKENAQIFNDYSMLFEKKVTKKITIIKE